MLNYPNIGDIVRLKRLSEPNIFGLVIGYVKVEATGGTLVRVEWFDGMTSPEYPNMLEIQNG